MPARRTLERPAAVALAWALPLVITLGVVACFAPALSNGFVNWDDGVALTENVHYRGLSGAHLAWMFTTLHLGHYQPVSWLAYALIYEVWGLDPFGYHLASVTLHAANAVVLFFVISGLIERTAGGGHGDGVARYVAAGVGSLFFALHPLRVEAVAWATQLRLLLCAFFLLLSLLAYLPVAARRAPADRLRFGWLSLCVGLYALAMLSNAIALAFPFVLLALDVYPLRRFTADGGWGARAAVVIEKVPFIVVSVAAALAAVVGARQQAMLSFDTHGVVERAVQALYGLAFYLWKTALPVALSPLYRLRLPFDAMQPQYLAPALVAAGITAGLLAVRRRYPWGLFAWLGYAMLLAPVTGLLQSGPQIAADRYTYVACLPWAVVAGVGAARVAFGTERRGRGWRRPAFVLAVAAGVLCALGVRTAAYTRAWRDALALWTHAIAVDPNNSFAYNNRGTARRARGDLGGALADFDAAIRADPESHAAHTNRGALRQATGDLGGALGDYGRAISLSPQDGRAYANRGTVRQAMGDLAGAAADYESALRLTRDHADIFYNRATLRQAMGDLNGALRDYDEAIRLDAASDKAYNNRGVVRQTAGDLPGAIADFTMLLRLRPNDPRAYTNRCNAHLASGDIAAAIADCDRALQLDAANAYAYAARGRARQLAGDAAGALADFGEAIRLNPTYARAFNSRAALRYAKGDVEGAVADYTRAVELAANADDRRLFTANLTAVRQQLELLRQGR